MMSKATKQSPPRGWRRGLWGFAVLGPLIALGSAGCNDKPAAAQAPPPPAVTVAHPLQQDVIEWDVFTGHLDAPEVANVAARVSGLVTEMAFPEGAIVKKGDLLAVIDDRPFKADLDAKVAEEKKTEAQLAIAKLTWDRFSSVQNTNAVSQQDVDNAKATVDQALATLAAAKAAVESSRLNLEWTRVLSPINGRVSDKLVTAGNLVTSGGGPAPPTLLTTVQSVNPVYCYVDVDENSVLKYQKLASEGKLASTREGKVPCYVALANETNFPHEGFIDFVDNHIDINTGTQRVRGVLKNDKGLLIPGSFARLSIPGSGKYKALLVPDTAIGTDQSQRNVLVLDKDNKVEARPVEIGALFGGLRSIVSGVTPDDRVIINGQMHSRPGIVVTPTDGEIKFDAAALSGPGGTMPHTIPSTAADSPAEAATASPATQSASPDATGNRS